MSREDICNLFRDSAGPVNRYLPTTNSGTARLVSRRLCGDQNLISGADAKLRTENYDFLAQKIAEDPAGIGIIGYAFYAKHMNDLVVLAPDGVEVNFDNVNSGRYPLTRDLYLYTSAAALAKPQVFNWVNFAVSSVSTMLERIAYFPVSTAVRSQSETLLRKVPPAAR